MTNKIFSSASFGETKAELQVNLPDVLAHKAVEKSDSDSSAKFSAERKHPVHIVNVPSNTISMTIGGLLPRRSLW